MQTLIWPALLILILNQKKEKIKVVDTHLSIMIPYGCFGQLVARPSIAKKGLIVLGGVIKFGYTGEVRFTLHNLSRKEHNFAYGNSYPYFTRGSEVLVYNARYPRPKCNWEEKLKKMHHKNLFECLYKYFVTCYVAMKCSMKIKKM